MTEKSENEANPNPTTSDATPAKQEEAPVEVPKYRSVVLSAYGGTKHVRVESEEVKAPGKNEIEVTVEACGMNFLDIMVRQGLIDQTTKPPFILGAECAGTVSAVGEDVTTHRVGDRVVVILESGAWAEKIIIPVEKEVKAEGAEKPTKEFPESTIVLPWPSSLSAAEAAILPFAYLPAYFLLHKVANVSPGDVVLVHSAGGGVGSAIGQLAKTIPDVKLIGTASKAKHEKLTGLYDVLLTPDQDCLVEIKKLYPQGINVILDCLSGEDVGKSYNLLKPLGKYVLYGMSNLVTGDRKNFFSLAKHWFHMERISPLRLHEDNRMLGGFCLKSLLFPRHHHTTSSNTNVCSSADLIRETWAKLEKLVESKSIQPWVDSEWSFEEAKEAMARLQERKNIGKVVLLPKAKPKEPQTTEAAK